MYDRNDRSILVALSAAAEYYQDTHINRTKHTHTHTHTHTQKHTLGMTAANHSHSYHVNRLRKAIQERNETIADLKLQLKTKAELIIDTRAELFDRHNSVDSLTNRLETINEDIEEIRNTLNDTDRRRR